MGFLKKLFGRGGDEDEAQPSSKQRQPAPEAEDQAPAMSERQRVRMLKRQLGASSAKERAEAARELAEREERSAMRPLLNAYLNYGEPALLDALRVYGPTLSPAVRQEASDLGLVGTRRARLLDVFAVTGDEQLLPVLRDNVEDNDIEVHARACAAMTRLGDMQGIDTLAHDLQLRDEALRTLALNTLRELGSDRAEKAVADHIGRYLAEGGAVPDDIDVFAPRLADPERTMASFVAEHVTETPHDLVVVVGSGAAEMAAGERDDLLDGLSGYDVHFTTQQMAPEEQLDVLEKARDAAARAADASVVVFGQLPSPHDSPPLPHFLTKVDGKDYRAKIVIYDPHEFSLVMDWWRYIDDESEVPTDVEVILSVAKPATSAIRKEEYLLYQLAPETRKRQFARAFLAHL